MANLTKAAMRDRVLENLGILAAGQGAAAEDNTLVGEVIDSVHERLRKDGLAPFATSAIPEWAQSPFRDVVSGELVNAYGIQGQRLQSILARAAQGRSDLAKYVQGADPPIPVKAYYY